jgi:hypothetical protein
VKELARELGDAPDATGKIVVVGARGERRNGEQQRGKSAE